MPQIIITIFYGQIGATSLSMINNLTYFFITFAAILDNLTPTLAYWKGGSGVYNATPENPSKKTGPNRKLTRFHEFLITLLRLRLALPTFVIADILGISCTRVSQIFVTWINYMNVVFSPLLKRPSPKCMKKFLTKCFKSVFPKTTCIIDCTEFFLNGLPPQQHSLEHTVLISRKIPLKL